MEFEQLIIYVKRESVCKSISHSLGYYTLTDYCYLSKVEQFETLKCTEISRKQAYVCVYI